MSSGQRESNNCGYLTPADVAKRLNLSIDTVIRLVRDEPGVFQLPQRSSLRKRSYTTLRIPDFVLERVIKKYSR